VAENESTNQSSKTAESREKAGRQPDAPRLFGPADDVEDNRSTAAKALENQIAPDAPARPDTYNPGYSMADEDREGEESDWQVDGNDASGFVGVNAEYRNYSNETEKPHDFEEVEGKAVDTLAEASENSKVDPMPVQHTDEADRRGTASKKTAAGRQ
jgi:hypothetical protein